MADFLIKMRIDAAEAQQANQQLVGGFGKVQAAAQQAASIQEDAFRQTTRKILQEAQTAHRAAADAQIQEAKRAAQAQEREADRLIAAYQKVLQAEALTADGGEESFSRMGLAAGIAQVAFSKIVDVVGVIGQGIDRAAESSQRLADSFRTERDRLAELAAIEGKRLDNQYVLSQAKFNVATGFTPEQGIRFRSELLNAGQQFVGRNISEQEAQQYQRQAGSLARARGLEPGVAGNLAGSLLGFTDFSKFGDQASEQALGKLNQGLAILARGKGENKVLVQQATELAAAALSEDDLQGVFKDFSEVTTAISVMAERNASEAETFVRAALRGLRDFSGKGGELLKRAGITATTGFQEATERLAPIVRGEAQQRGLKVEDVLRGYFPDERTVVGLGTAINRGVGGGIFADRARFAQGFTGPAAALGDIAQFQQSEAGRSLQADALIKLAEARRGAQTSGVDILRRQALSQLIQTREIDSTSAQISNLLLGKISFGGLGDQERQLISQRATEIELGRAERAGLQVGPLDRAGLIGGLYTPEGQEAGLNRLIGEVSSRGFDPFTDKMEKLATALDRNTQATEANSKTGQPQQQRPAQPAPALGRPRPSAQPDRR